MLRLRGLLKKFLGAQGPAREELKTELILEAEAAAEALQARRENLPELVYPEELPVSQRREEIVEAIKKHQVVIIAGETGSGKTTQIPKMCLEAGCGLRGMIGHTQPRRLAARSVAARIAAEMGERLGQSVGFKVRFADTVGEDAYLKLMTDGILLSETASDHLLLHYDCIIIDEAHERSLNIDFLLGYLKKLLQRRPELKLIITSATIDPQRFSEHFGRAPVIEVSGRTYPVELIYLPPEEIRSQQRRRAGKPEVEDEARDARRAREVAEDGGDDEELNLNDAVLYAFRMLMHEYGRGDVLVFLPGEREIMELAGFLKKAHLPGTEILPLYARLAHAEQSRIFTSHQGVRIVLATNVAETSLTVPGIRYVIDPGLARVSRYSPRTKVQRLPVEKISRASADQRKGRCGRVSAGVCVRLYSEEDWLSRAEFTDPEILRTNLASVILKMVDLHLGDIREFPFIDSPEPRQITDGMRLLEELGAIVKTRTTNTAELKLTPLGVQLSRLPADPRLSRMLLEAGRRGCLNEVLIIVSGLSVMDPRLEPPDKKEDSRRLHKRFEDEHSDFLSWLKLYAYAAGLQTNLSGSAYRRTLKKEYLSYLRIREWSDLQRQLRASCLTLGLHPNEVPADYENIHRALLCGLLSQTAYYDGNEKGQYLGARGVKLVLHPSSALCKKPPKWLCAAEFSETSRLFARCAAAVQSLWIEQAAPHLIRRSYQEPHWSGRAGAVVASESVTLYGLTLASGRQVQYSSIDQALCRELFIRDGLVGGNIGRSYDFLKHNLTLRGEVEHLEDKFRRRDLLENSAVLEEFYSKRIPQNIVTARHFDKWWREKSRTEPHYLDFPDDLLLKDTGEDLQEQLFPEFWELGRYKLRLSYAFDPGADNDGVSVHIPVTLICQIDASVFAYQIPGLRQELFTALIKSLPKRLRRNLIPAPEFARALGEALGEELSGPLKERAAAKLTRMGGEVVRPEDFNSEFIPAYLQMNFVIEDPDGKVLGQGRNFAALSAALQGRAQEVIREQLKPKRQSPPSSQWTFGTIKREHLSRRSGTEFTAYPALTDHGRGVSLEFYDCKERQEIAMWQGQRRLLLLGLKQPVSYLEAHLPNRAKLALYYKPLGTVQELLEDLSLGAVDRLMRKNGAPVWEEQEFLKLRDQVRQELNGTALELARTTESILLKAHELKHLLRGNIPLEVASCWSGTGAWLDTLVYKGFVSSTPPEHFAELPRYLEAGVQRLQKAPRDPVRDRRCQFALSELNDAYQAALRRYPQDLVPPPLKELRWMTEELRVSFFAQQLGVKIQVSQKRISFELQRILKEWPPRL